MHYGLSGLWGLVHREWWDHNGPIQWSMRERGNACVCVKPQWLLLTLISSSNSFSVCYTVTNEPESIYPSITGSSGINLIWGRTWSWSPVARGNRRTQPPCQESRVLFISLALRHEGSPTMNVFRRSTAPIKQRDWWSFVKAELLKIWLHRRGDLCDIKG